MQTPRSKRTHRVRPAIVAGAAVVGIMAASAAAVAANIGILGAADDGDIGALAASGDLVAPDTQIVDVYLDEPATTTSSVSPTTTTTTTTTAEPAATEEQFAVGPAGTVSVVRTPTGLRLGAVATTPGWSWTALQPDASTVRVTLTNGDRTLEFRAALAPDGSIDAGLDEPITAAAMPAGTASGTVSAAAPTATPPVAPVTSVSDDHGDDDRQEYEDDDHEDHEDHEAEDHEGREDDD